MHPILRVLNGLVTLTMFALLGLVGAIYFAKVQFDQPGPLKATTVVAIPKGTGLTEIAALLEREGVISNRFVFTGSARYFRAGDKLKAGEFEIRKGASMRDVLDMLVRGKSILYKVTIPEGYTSSQIVEKLQEAEHLTGELTDIPEEGSLMPDTYKYSRGMARQELIERMQEEQRKFVANLWEKRAPDLPIKDMDEAITLASIVEKETGRADERARVAAVFVNRLRRGMRLQSDPTIIYGVTQGKGSLGRGILKSEISQETPYNTYMIDGLPPGPIANPGRASIEAVLNPAKTNDLFFVADGTGGHAFATSLSEHNSNVARWRQIERQMREEAKRKEEEAARLAAKAATDSAGGADQAASGTSAGSDIPGVSLAPGIPGVSLGGSLDIPNLDLSQAANPGSRTSQDDAGTSVNAPAQSDSGIPMPLRRPTP